MAAVVAVMLVMVAGYTALTVGQASAAGPLISQGTPATASSTENAGTPAGAAVDGNTGTRWSSAFSDPQWIQVDLGATATIDQVTLNWEAAYARSFQIQVSANGDHLDDHLQHHDRHRRHADPRRQRHRPVRPDERHRPGHRRTATRCGSSRSSARSARRRLRHRQRGAGPAGHRVLDRERRRSRPSAAVDGNTGTRWSSAFSDPQWIQVDLGATATVCQVDADLGGGVRPGVPDPGLGQRRRRWTTIFSHHHRHRRHADARPSAAPAGTCG